MNQVLAIPTRYETPEPPAHLSEESKRRWAEILAGWEMEAESLMLLQASLEQWDAYRVAQAVLAKDGPTVTNTDSGVIRQHPASLVARDALKAFRLCMKDLGLKDTP